MAPLSRRQLLGGGLAVAGSALLAACTDPVSPHGTGRSFGPPTPVAPTPGQRVVEHVLRPRPVTVDLGGTTVETWAYGDTVPGPLLRARAGDLLRVRVENGLPDPTTVHWHGVALRNEADGVPGLTQDPIAPGGTYTYDFTVPDAGTFFFHPHVGVQLDRGLYGALVVEDPADPGDHDEEWVVVLDDWVDGTGRTPDDVLAGLRSGGDAHGMGHGGMDHGAMGHGPGAATGAVGDVAYPHHLVNGRVPADPEVLRGRAGQRVRLRVVNAGSDTMFRVALGGHRLRVTHTDGYAVVPRDADSVVLAMGERFDATVTLADGVFPLVADAVGKEGGGLALVRTGAGAAPGASVRPRELDGEALLLRDLLPAEPSRLPAREPDAAAPLTLVGSMSSYEWGINGGPYGHNDPITVGAGQRLRLDVANMTSMAHPVHVHGHTFAVAGSGLRKDTVLVRPMETLPIVLDATNEGSWMVHCHNVYHAEAGMMIALEYTR